MIEKSNLRLDIIQVMRGLAALAVVLHHGILSLNYFQNYNNIILDYVQALGKFGVDFFFVLSGFIITYSALSKNKSKVGKYYLNRALRIYIPYLPIGLTIYFFYYLFPSFSASERQFSFINSLTLFPIGNPALSVAWTLTYEMFFYTIFILFLLNRRVWNIFTLTWAAIIIIINILEINFGSYQFLTSLYHLEFIIGYLLGLFYVYNREYLKRGSLFVMLSLLLASFLVFTYYFQNPFSNLIYALFFASLMYYVLLKNYNYNNASLAMIIGNATFSIYLIHNPLISFVVRFLPKYSSWQSHLIYIFIIVILSSLIGYVYYLIFEKYLTNKAKFFFQPRRP